jgi:hypothetical protein
VGNLEKNDEILIENTDVAKLLELSSEITYKRNHDLQSFGILRRALEKTKDDISAHLNHDEELKTDNLTEKEFYNFLVEHGIARKDVHFREGERNETSKYKITSPEYLEFVKSEIRIFDEETVSKLQNFAEEHGRSPYTSEFNGLDELPDANTVNEMYADPRNGENGGINNLLWRAGLEPNSERFDEDILEEEYLRITYENDGEVASLKDIKNHEKSPTYPTFNNHVGGIRQLAEQTGLASRRNVQRTKAEEGRYLDETADEEPIFPDEDPDVDYDLMD